MDESRSAPPKFSLDGNVCGQISEQVGEIWRGKFWTPMLLFPGLHKIFGVTVALIVKAT